ARWAPDPGRRGGEWWRARGWADEATKPARSQYDDIRDHSAPPIERNIRRRSPVGIPSRSGDLHVREKGQVGIGISYQLMSDRYVARLLPLWRREDVHRLITLGDTVAAA